MHSLQIKLFLFKNDLTLFKLICENKNKTASTLSYLICFYKYYTLSYLIHPIMFLYSAN
jgi:hypothetical protein